MAGFGESGEDSFGGRLGDGGAAAAMTEELRRLRAEMAATEAGAERLAGSISGSLRNAFDRLVTGGMKASDVLKGLGRDLLGRTFDAAAKPVHGALTEGLTSAMGGLFAGVLGGGAAGVAAPVTAFAEGGVLSAGRARAFAAGGVVDGPTVFGMPGGLGLMGEAGPEAILPLRRGADGRLGVAAGDGGGGAPRVTVNIQTPDVAGFARSRGQVAAQIARAVDRGRRRM